jgi:spermidine synthase
MKPVPLLLAVLSGLIATTALAAPKGNYVESFDTLYNSLTVEKRGTVVELRAHSRSTAYIESAVDLADPLRLVVPYTKTLYAGLFFAPNPQRVLMVGLGGAGFHRPFAESLPDTLLQTVELDAKVFELCQSHLGFKPTEKTPVAVIDGRLFVKRDKTKWDWLILDAFRGGFAATFEDAGILPRMCGESERTRRVHHQSPSELQIV